MRRGQHEGGSCHPREKRGSSACPWHEQGATAEALGVLGSRFRGNDENGEGSMSDTAEILDQAARWREAGAGVALATVVSTWGSSPRPVGAKLAVDEKGAMVGSVSGGC